MRLHARENHPADAAAAEWAGGGGVTNSRLQPGGEATAAVAPCPRLKPGVSHSRSAGLAAAAADEWAGGGGMETAQTSQVFKTCEVLSAAGRFTQGEQQYANDFVILWRVDSDVFS